MPSSLKYLLSFELQLKGNNNVIIKSDIKYILLKKNNPDIPIYKIRIMYTLSSSYSDFNPNISS